VEALKREQLSRRKQRELGRPRETDTPVRPITSYHEDSRYAGDLHRAGIAARYMLTRWPNTAAPSARTSTLNRPGELDMKTLDRDHVI